MDKALEHRLKVWCDDRQRARTDLLWLSNEILLYKDVEQDPHGRLFSNLQRFMGGKDYINPQNGAFVKYEPACPLWHLQGHRFRLFLWPRDHLKTSVITIAHTIQWIINYPDVRILISTAIEDQASSMCDHIRSFFQFSERFRFLFPEFCPEAQKVKEFGNSHEFTVPCRKILWKEPTVSVSSIGKVIAGFHYEVQKYSDMVDKENVKTLNAIKEVNNHFDYTEHLLEKSEVAPHHGWKDVEGTRYAISDLYGNIKRKEAKAQHKNWLVVEDSADPRDRADGKPLWPKRFPESELKRIEEENPQQYSAQYRQRPVAESSALATEKEILFFPEAALAKINLRKHVTVDLHGMEDGATNDYTVINLSGFGRDGRCYVLELRRGRFTPFEIINHLFDIQKQHRPLDVKIEKDAHARVLLPFLEREQIRRGAFMTIVPLKRDNKTSKPQRIRGLQSWFKAGILRFSEGITCKLDMVEEILNFGDPSVHDDILDTIADQMQNRDGEIEGDIYPYPAEQVLPAKPPWENKFLGFGEGNDFLWSMDMHYDTQMVGIDRKTGV